MLRALVAMVLLLASPTAAAFSTQAREIDLRYLASDTPIVFASGELAIEGALRGGLLVAGVVEARLARIPTLVLIDNAANRTVDGATLVVHDGALVWAIPEGASLSLDVAAPYGIALATPQAPIPDAEGAGFVVASESVSGTAEWSGQESALVVLGGNVTVLDAQGRPLPGYDHRRVSSDVSTGEGAFGFRGRFAATLSGAALAGAVGSGADVALAVGPAERDRFVPTMTVLATTMQEVASVGEGGRAGEGGLPEELDLLGGISGIVNGGIIVVPEDAAPRLATLGDEPFAVEGFTMMRGGELGVAWRGGEMRVQGEPDVVLGRNGFEVDAPATVGILPVASLVLWAVAVGAVVWLFVKRPDKSKGPWSWRLLGMGAHLVVFLLVAFLWDLSFKATFGTSVLTQVMEGGLSPERFPQLGMLLAFEALPWGLASLLFALPVRIATGVGLRHLGKGKALSGFAKGAGLVSLIVLGPVYALWITNVVLEQVLSRMPGFGP